MRPPPDLIDDLRAAGLSGAAFGSAPNSAAGEAADMPCVPGAYLLLIGVARPLSLTAPRFADTTLPAGWYVYAGSANGPGGLRARVARHLRADKRAHWHVDHLTQGATVLALGFPGAGECALADRLAAAPRFVAPLPGFGSSDCARCVSHLVAWRGREVPG